MACLKRERNGRNVLFHLVFTNVTPISISLVTCWPVVTIQRSAQLADRLDDNVVAFELVVVVSVGQSFKKNEKRRRKQKLRDRKSRKKSAGQQVN